MSQDVFASIIDDYNVKARAVVSDNRIAVLDLFDFVLGDNIGRGEYRSVFEFPLNMNWIIKYEYNMMSNNAMEYDIWYTMNKRGKKYSKWFAPCIALSTCTKFLIMERTSEVLIWPDKVPKMLGDTHTGNFGMLDGKFVSHDYGSTKIMRDNFDLLKMKKAKWRT